MIYHITTQPEWDAAQAAGTYLPANFQADGFIHCSDLFQVEGVANRFYKETPALILLQIDQDKVPAPLVYENLEGGDMPFPHLYGPLPTSAVVAVHPILSEDGSGLRLPQSLRVPKPMLFSEFPFGLPGRVYRSTMPFSQEFDPDQKVFSHYQAADLHTVVVLNPADELERYSGRDLLAQYRAAGFNVIHSPTADFSAPPKGHWDSILQTVENLARSGENLVIHCHAGVGRTGIFAACMAQDVLGLSADEAINWVRQSIPFAVETAYQQQFVRAYRAQ